MVSSMLLAYGTSFLINSFKCTSDPNVYIKRSNGSVLHLELYVDDLILISNNMQFLLATKTLLIQCSSMIDNKETEYILGIQIH
jgi:hypothetical protein